MGCDIHGFIEVKHKGKWECYDKIPLRTRNYDLFSLIAGIRGNEKPISEPKGIPEDVSEIVKAEFKSWEEDAHTPTWLSSKESNEVYKKFDKIVKRDLKNQGKEEKDAWLVYGIDSFVYQLDTYGSYFLKENLVKYEDVRIVIWFDN